MTPRSPIVFGDADGRPSQPATFKQAHGPAKPGQYLYVAGSGVEEAVEAGVLEIGYRPHGGRAVQHASKPTPKPASPEFYVATGRNRWVGFKTRPAAERYAKTIDAEVLTKDEVLAANLKTKD